MHIPVYGFIAAQLLSLGVGGLIVHLITETRRAGRKRTAMGQLDVVESMVERANEAEVQAAGV